MNLAQHPVDIPFGKQLKLIGYDRSDGAKSGGSFDVTLHWQVLKTPKEDYITSLKLINAAYRTWGEVKGLAGGQWALTSSWPRGQVIKDRRQLIILPGTPPGEYQLEIALFDPYRNRALEPAGSTDAHLGPIRVQRAYPNSRELAIEHRTDSVLADRIRLLGYNLVGDRRPGLPVHLILFWQAQTAPGRPYTVFTHVLDGNSKVWAGKDNEPVDGFYPTTQWTPGEVVRDPYDIPLPTDLAPGEYRLSVGMYDPTTQERLPVPGAENSEILLGPVLVSP
jgi:hypothetical protein